MIDPTRSVTDAELETYDRDGVVVLHDICPADWVDEFRTALDQVFNRETETGREGLVSGASRAGSRAGSRVDVADRVRQMLDEHDASTLAIEPDRLPEGRSIVETDACSWHDGLRDLHVTGPLPEVAAALTRGERVNLYSDQLFLKEPGSSVRTPWHQDKPYWLLQGTKVAVCWVPADEVTMESGVMGYVAGSHRWGKVFKPNDFVTLKGTMSIPGLNFDGLDDLPAIDDHPDDFDVRRYEAGPGDVIVHNWMTLHGSLGQAVAEPAWPPDRTCGRSSGSCGTCGAASTSERSTQQTRWASHSHRFERRVATTPNSQTRSTPRSLRTTKQQSSSWPSGKTSADCSRGEAAAGRDARSSGRC